VLVAVAGALGLGWLVPTVTSAGGWETFREIAERHRQLNASASPLGVGWGGLEMNLMRVAIFAGNGLGAGVVVGFVVLIFRVTGMSRQMRAEWNARNGAAMRVMALWVLPLMALGMVGVTNQPGYVLDYLVALLVLVAVAAAHVPARWFAGVVGAVAIFNAGLFGAWSASWAGLFVGTTRTLREIRRHGDASRQWVAAVRSNASPETTLLCFPTWSAVYGVRHAQWLMPEYSSVQLLEDRTMMTPAGRPLFGMAAGAVRFYSLEEVRQWPRRLVVLPPGADERFVSRYLDLTRARPVGAGPVKLLVLE
jgi:hypothetical protein